MDIETVGTSVVGQLADLATAGPLVIAAALPIGMAFWAVNYFKGKGKQTAK